jgi:hypothetical protein
MTKKDFEAIAAILRIAVVEYGTVEEVVLALCEDFAARYPNFDDARFIRACGLEG